MGFFAWIRSRVRAAVIAGFNDALAELDAIAAEPAPALALQAAQPDVADESATHRRDRKAGRR